MSDEARNEIKIALAVLKTKQDASTTLVVLKLAEIGSRISFESVEECVCFLDDLTDAYYDNETWCELDLLILNALINMEAYLEVIDFGLDKIIPPTKEKSQVRNN